MKFSSELAFKVILWRNNRHVNASRAVLKTCGKVFPNMDRSKPVKHYQCQCIHYECFFVLKLRYILIRGEVFILCPDICFLLARLIFRTSSLETWFERADCFQCSDCRMPGYAFVRLDKNISHGLVSARRNKTNEPSLHDNLVPRLSLHCLPLPLGERPWLWLVTLPPRICVVKESVGW